MLKINDFSVSLCDKLSEAEILFRKCPQDNLAGHVEMINEKLRNGLASLYSIKKGDEKIGFFCAEIFDKTFHVLALSANGACGVFDNISTPFIEKIAEKSGCACVAFSTVRPGLIKQAIKSGFNVSEIVMKKYL